VFLRPNAPGKKKRKGRQRILLNPSASVESARRVRAARTRWRRSAWTVARLYKRGEERREVREANSRGEVKSIRERYLARNARGRRWRRALEGTV
jgi:hypothetical protein